MKDRVASPSVGFFSLASFRRLSLSALIPQQRHSHLLLALHASPVSSALPRESSTPDPPGKPTTQAPMEKLARRTHAVTNQNTPRSIRARLSRPRRKPLPEAPMPEAPAQQVARSSSGRTALGPWLGSFGVMDQLGGLLDQEPVSPTLFATSQGRVFADLAGSPVASTDLLAMPSSEAASVGHSEDAGKVVGRANLQEMAVLKRKAEAPRSRGPEGRGPRVNRSVRRYRMIGQARKMN